MARKPPRKVRMVVGLPTWSRTVFEVVTCDQQRVSDAKLEAAAEGARRAGWKHVQIVSVQPKWTTPHKSEETGEKR